MTHVVFFIVKIIASIFIVCIGLLSCIVSLIVWDGKFVDMADEMMFYVWSKSINK